MNTEVRVPSLGQGVRLALFVGLAMQLPTPAVGQQTSLIFVDDQRVFVPRPTVTIEALNRRTGNVQFFCVPWLRGGVRVASGDL